MDGQLKGKLCPATGRAFHPDAFVMEFKNLSYDGQSESRNTGLPLLRRTLFIVGLKNELLILGWNATAGVFDANGYIRAVLAERDINGTSGRCKAQGIAEKVFDHPLHQGNVGIHEGHLRIGGDVNGYVFILC